MNRRIFKLALIAAGLTTISASSYAQKAQKQDPGFTVPVKNGSVAASLKAKGMTKTEVARSLVSMLGLSDKHTFVEVSEKTDKLGFTHTTYQQYYQGVPVESGKILVHFKNGTADNINGKVVHLGTMAVQPSIAEEAAAGYAANSLSVNRTIRTYPVQLVITAVSNGAQKEYALAYKVRIDGYTTEKKVVMKNVYVDAGSGKVLRQVSLIAHTDATGTAHTLYSGMRTINTDSTADGYRLRDNVRKIETYDAGGAEPDGGWGSDVFTNARDYFSQSTDWDEQPALMEMSLTGVASGSGLLTGLGSGNFVTSLVLRGDLSTAETVSWPDIHFSGPTLPLPVIANNIYVFPADTGYLAGYAKVNFSTGDISDSAFFYVNNLAAGTHPWTDAAGNTGTFTIAKQKNPALDAHWGMEMTHDYYSEVLDRNSYDDNGGVVKNYVNGIWPFIGDQNNAMALPAPYFSMLYGMGDGENMNPVVGLDVMGHEFTHIVTGVTAELEYQGESGALNESFSDIFGTAIEFYTKGQAGANWTVGEDVVIAGNGIFRSMSNPKAEQNPDTYEGQFWIPVTSPEDNGGVHTNSGVQNKWFYLLSVGGNGTNDKGDAYSVTGIGIDKAEQIAYRNLTTYLTMNSDYMDAYAGSLQSAIDLFPSDSSVYRSVKDAWYAVGIGEKDSTTAVTEVQVNSGDLKLYPNPATQRVTIASSLDQPLEAQILNVVGTPVMTISVSKGLNPVDISTLAKGVYMIRYNTGVKGYVQKLSVL